MALEKDERKFVGFWLFIFGSALAFWAFVIHWVIVHV